MTAGVTGVIELGLAEYNYEAKQFRVTVMPQKVWEKDGRS